MWDTITIVMAVILGLFTLIGFIFIFTMERRRSHRRVTSTWVPNSNEDEEMILVNEDEE